MSETIRQRCRRFRRVHNLTLDDVASRMGVTRQAVHHFETFEGKKAPSAAYVARYAAALGVSVEDLEGAEPPPTLEQACWLFKRLWEHMQGSGSFGHLVHQRLGYTAPDAYNRLYLAGGMVISNALDEVWEREMAGGRAPASPNGAAASAPDPLPAATEAFLEGADLR